MKSLASSFRARWLHLCFSAVLAGCAGVPIARSAEVAPAPRDVTFVFLSDVHFGITRSKFRGDVSVESRVVNAALVEQINALPSAHFPSDPGLGAERAIGAVDFVVITGDLTNRQELYPIKIQSAATSWAQFEACYVDGLRLKDPTGHPTPLLLVPGNHDVSNAIGAPSKLVPATDATSLAQIYNRMLQPATPRTKDSYSSATDRIVYARDFGGVHCIFLTIWPDTATRAWIADDLKQVPATTPVFLFAHDPPEADPKHFTNPNGKHDMNPEDRFENISADVYADGPDADDGTLIEQRALAGFLKTHRNIVAYFHGHSNWTEFYTWSGPDGDLALHTFRSDSPMKGKISGKDETQLAFQVVTYDLAQQKLTARECLWNATAEKNHEGKGSASMAWGNSKTISLEFAAPEDVRP